MATTDERVILPAPSLRGSVRVPGDKSISHRVAMLAALAEGESRVSGFLDSEDCLHTLGAMELMGARVRREGASVAIEGTGGALRSPPGILDMGNSGTGIRLLSGLLAGQSCSAELTGDASLRSRPMRRIQVPLARMGARLELLGPGGCAPIRITGARLKGMDYPLPVASAQVKSCVLLAGLFAEGRTVVREPMPTRDHTEILFRAMGIGIRQEGPVVSVEGTAGGRVRIAAGDWAIPGDFSSAAFWLVAAASREGAEVRIEGVGLNPRRTALLDVLRRMGADITVDAQPTGGQGRRDGWEASGNLLVRGRKLRGTDIGGMEIPNLVDELPILAVAGALADGQTTIRDAQELRVKESDRIATVAEGIRRFGGSVEERPDGMAVSGGVAVKGGVEIDSHDDHRVAMAMSILALWADAPVRITRTWCVGTSYPAFWDDLAKLSGEPNHG